MQINMQLNSNIFMLITFLELIFMVYTVIIKLKKKKEKNWLTLTCFVGFAFDLNFFDDFVKYFSVSSTTLFIILHQLN